MSHSTAFVISVLSHPGNKLTCLNMRKGMNRRGNYPLGLSFTKIHRLQGEKLKKKMGVSYKKLSIKQQFCDSMGYLKGGEFPVNHTV